jgi:hypothetical protein
LINNKTKIEDILTLLKVEFKDKFADILIIYFFTSTLRRLDIKNDTNNFIDPKYKFFIFKLKISNILIFF